MKKKFLSLVLACALTVGSLPCAVWADDTTALDGAPTTISEGDIMPAGESEEVTYPAPVKAILHDASGKLQDSELYTNYYLLSNPSNGRIVISAKDLRKHSNGSADGYWVGMALAAPDGADGFKYCFSTAEVPSTESALEPNVTADGKSGAAFYFDVAKGRSGCVGIQWTKNGGNLGTAQWYYVNMSDVETLAVDSTHRYGVLAEDIFESADYDNAVHFTGNDTIYELDIAGIVPKKNSLVIYTLADKELDTEQWSEVKVLKEIKHRNGIVDSGLPSGEASDVTTTGFNTATNAWTFANDVAIYVMDESTGKFTLGSKADVANGDYVYIGEADSNTVKLLIVDEYNYDVPSVSAPALSASTMELTVGNFDTSLELNGIALSDYGNITWTSSNTAVATVTQGTANNAIITAVAPGTTTITAKLNNQSYTCEVTVKAAPVAVTGVTLSESNVDMNVGATKTLTATVSPDNATNKKVTWSSSDSSVVSVDENGKITAVAPGGPVNITATTEDGNFSASAGVTVYQPATSITLEKSSLKLAPTEGFELHYTLNPTNSTDSVTWESSDESVVTVNAQGNPSYGMVDAVAEGTATITATTTSGKTATCTVTVAPHLADFVVTINGTDTGYDSFAEAWAAAIATSGSTLTLNKNVELTGDTLVVADTTITINSRDSYTTIKDDSTFTGTELIKVAEGGTLNLGGHLCAYVDSSTNCAALKVDGGTLNINGAEAISNTGAALSIENGGTVTMNNGKLYQNDSKNRYAVWIDDGIFNIKGGEVFCRWNQYTQLIHIYNGTVNMSDGKVEQIVFDALDDDYVAKANISGGTLSSLVFEDYNYGTQSATITGGTFSFDPTEYVPTSGYTITHNGNAGDVDESWTVTKKSSGGGGGGGSSKKDDTTKTDEVKTDEVKTEEKTETTTPETMVAPGEATTENISQVFGDTKSDDWYAEAAAYAYNNGLMKGNGDGSFGANDNATRGQIVTILHRLANEPDAGTADFDDINGNEYYAEGVAWAAANGIVNGYEDGNFGANGNVTREELATILYRFAKAQDKLGDKTGDLSGFGDGATASDWAAEALAWAVGSGLLQGDETGSLNPTGTATRAEIATILMRFCENFAK